MLTNDARTVSAGYSSGSGRIEGDAHCTLHISVYDSTGFSVSTSISFISLLPAI